MEQTKQGFMLKFDAMGNRKQLEAIRYWNDKETEVIVYGGSKGSGKSYLGASLLFGTAFIYPDTHFFIARREMNDIRKYTIPTINEVFARWGVTSDMWRYNTKDDFYQLYNGSCIFFLEARYMPKLDPEFSRFGSIQMTGGWIEEGGEFMRPAYETLSATIGRKNNDTYGLKGKLLITCNPADNFLKTDFYDLHRRGELPSTKKFVQALPYDNKMLPKDYIRRLENTLSPERKKTLLEGNWDFNTRHDQLITQPLLESFREKKQANHYSGIGVDVARYGDDTTVITVIKNGYVVEVLRRTKLDNAEVADLVFRVSQQHKISLIAIDANGLGAGVFDILKRRLGGVIEYIGSQKPSESDYRLARDISLRAKNMRSFVYYLLQTALQNRVFSYPLLFENELLVKELRLLTYEVTDKDFILQPKDAMKAQLGFSPDNADSLSLAIYAALHSQKIYVPFAT